MVSAIACYAVGLGSKEEKYEARHYEIALLSYSTIKKKILLDTPSTKVVQARGLVKKIVGSNFPKSLLLVSLDLMSNVTTG